MLWAAFKGLTSLVFFIFFPDDVLITLSYTLYYRYFTLENNFDIIYDFIKITFETVEKKHDLVLSAETLCYSGANLSYLHVFPSKICSWNQMP